VLLSVSIGKNKQKMEGRIRRGKGKGWGDVVSCVVFKNLKT
jgi:hypothetical protein